ncbi:flagellar basal body P-ring formation chaperone FlgA [Tranquillimonas alkanivorans]|uniref:Flagella basal body P-ring formation protein FlgA n=1 Tax=Tranquillimonas alkanivorans TaxID=441119 RepID=A0A1I5S514_9RHOB|nr:flagellar basal body P-ring formation chaperone FlgA [Tranquillimonas alkanivorans]SFP65858.1 flagella basal body P-ring formation protein FlgA [Tranquillimonas alkanivorans]
MRRLITLLTALLLCPALAGAEALNVLIEEKARESYGTGLPDTGEFEITVQGGGDLDAVMLSAFWMDTSTGQFVANAVLPEGDVRRISGLALLTVPVPVPLRRIMPDEILSEADLKVVRLPHGRVGAFAVTGMDDLVGMQVRRVLSQGRPVMAQSVMQPLVIDRGDRVAIRFRDGRLELSAPGRALADAHRGQEVKIVNLVSNTSLVGIATGEGVVEVIN